jgi:hypothetical protein
MAPEIVHYLADIRHWILLHMALALHFEHKTDPRSPQLTPKRLLTSLGDTSIASRNTVQAFLRKVARIQLTDPPKAGMRRQHATQASLKSEKLILVYIDIHLRALDTLDGADRSGYLIENPGFLHFLQPNFARRICLKPAWYSPPETIKCFIDSVSGSSILHEMILSTQSVVPDQDGRLWVDFVSFGELATRYHVSPAHISRMLKRAQKSGGIGWERQARRGACWLSIDLRDAYLLWQAEKLAALSSAYVHASDAMSDKSRLKPNADM